MRESAEARRQRARAILRQLERAYPDATIALHFSTPLELLVATILAAQCTDERVNMVTRDLFTRYRTAEDWTRADLATLEDEIRSTGFFRAKAKSIVGCARALVERHGGEVPSDLDALTALSARLGSVRDGRKALIFVSEGVTGSSLRLREIATMSYLWRIPHSLDGARLRALLPDFEALPPAEAVACAVADLLGRDASATTKGSIGKAA